MYLLYKALKETINRKFTDVSSGVRANKIQHLFSIKYAAFTQLNNSLHLFKRDCYFFENISVRPFYTLRCTFFSQQKLLS